ncbi:MAG: hypothetical protein CL878_13610 [Dehalococcoidia bacterium]|nr:hypothetical protein [Dehalococcoidia bacterium]
MTLPRRTPSLTLIVALLLLTLLATAAPVAAAPAECEFVLGFKGLQEAITASEGPAKVGDCLEQERHNPTAGETWQRTAGGLLVWRKADNWTAFTDGHRTWTNGPFGLQQRLNTQRFPWEITSEDTMTTDFERAAEALVTFMVQGDFVKAAQDFDSTMREAMPAEQLQAIWTGLPAQVGRFEQLVGSRVAQQQGFNIVNVTVQFEQAALDVRVVFSADRKVAGLSFAPTPAATGTPAYVDLASFVEEEVVVGTGAWALPGTLSIPTGNGPFPAIVLVHGSGPNDRDETIGPNKPFKDLAWGLASRGIAVLRYDKQSLVHGKTIAADLSTFTVQEETIADALTGITLLRERAGIDREAVFVVGHSLGGTLAPRIGAQDPALPGLIILAGATTPIEDLLLVQQRYIFNLDGTISDEEATQLAQIEALVQTIKAPDLAAKVPATTPLLGAAPAYWLDLRDYSPAEAAKTLPQPMLVLQGERDYQVTMADFATWREALASRPDVTFKSYPALNHLFMAGEGPSTPAEYAVANHVAAQVISDIADWLQR